MAHAAKIKGVTMKATKASAPIRQDSLAGQSPGTPTPQGASDALRESLRGMSFEAGSAALSPFVQAKIETSQPGDALEREADRVADAVTSDGAATGRLGVGHVAVPTLSASGGSGVAVDPSAARELSAAKGGGSPVAASVREPAERTLGADLSDVRVHTDSKAAALADSMGARALTHGKDIHFGTGSYAPGDATGRKLIAHELTHTVQQGASERVAGWWKDGHRALTQAGGKPLVEAGQVDQKIVDWVASKAGSQDETARSWGNFVTSLTASFVAKKRYKRLRSSARKQNDLGGFKNPKDRRRAQKMWENLGFHLRWPVEKKYHGEAGGYTREDGATKNASAVENQIDKAARFYIGGKYREGLLQLADGLHSAEDRGSHGEGKPYTGHDPRLTMQERFDGTHNEHYIPGWDCDNPAVNVGGRALAEQYAKDGWQLFWDKVKSISTARAKLEGGKRGRLRPGGLKSKYLKHGFRFLMTPLTGAVGALAQKKDSKVSKLGGYEQIKQDHPDPDDPTADPVANMLRVYEKDMEVAVGKLYDSIDVAKAAFANDKSSPGKATYETIRDNAQKLAVLCASFAKEQPECQNVRRLKAVFGQLSIKAEEWRRRSSGMHKKSTKRSRNIEIARNIRMYETRIRRIVDEGGEG
jgi:hypothetical protein